MLRKYTTPNVTECGKMGEHRGTSLANDWDVSGLLSALDRYSWDVPGLEHLGPSARINAVGNS